MSALSAQVNFHARRSLLKLGLSAIAVGALPNAVYAAQQNVSYPSAVRALVFDVFGTVVDWHGSVVREGQQLGQRKGFDVDWVEFATRWRAGYGPAMNKVRTGELPWTKLDDLHRMVLDELVVEFGMTGMSEGELDDFNRAWHRLSPWPDTIAGLNRLRSRYIISTLSNGNVSLLVDMAKNAGLPWDAVLSAELAGHYKPDARAYLKAAELLGLAPDQVMLVAAHPSDLRGAAAAGLRTAYVYRPLERGPQGTVTPPAKDEFDMFSTSLEDLASHFGL